MGEAGAELRQADLPHRVAVDVQRPQGGAARHVGEVDHQAVRVAQEEVLVAEAAVAADGDRQLPLLLRLA